VNFGVRISKLAVIASTWCDEPINLKMISHSVATCSAAPALDCRLISQ
jgi:hypothetical protein